MEIKTNIELLNEISAKLGGKSDASVLVEGLNNIANALGDTDPDQMVTVPQALETVLEYVGGGGGGIEFANVECSLVLGESAIELGITSASAWLIGFLEKDGKLGLYDGIIVKNGESVSFKLPKNVDNILRLFGFVPETNQIFTTPQITGAHYWLGIAGDCLGENDDIVSDGAITLTLENDED